MAQQFSLVRKTFLTVYIVSAVAACSGGNSSIRYYLIDPIENMYSEPGDPELTVEIMDVHIPQYLERFNIVTRGARNELQLSEFHQWGDNLRKNLLRTLARNLSGLLSTNDIGTPENRTMSDPDYRVQVHIEQFERNYDGQVVLAARWQVETTDTSYEVSTHRAALSSAERYESGEYELIVGAMQELYGELGELIAKSINEKRGV